MFIDKIVIIQPKIYEFKPFYIFCDYNMNKNDLFPKIFNFRILGENGDERAKGENRR